MAPGFICPQEGNSLPPYEQEATSPEGSREHRLLQTPGSAPMPVLTFPGLLGGPEKSGPFASLGSPVSLRPDQGSKPRGG